MIRGNFTYKLQNLQSHWANWLQNERLESRIKKIFPVSDTTGNPRNDSNHRNVLFALNIHNFPFYYPRWSSKYSYTFACYLLWIIYEKQLTFFRENNCWFVIHLISGFVSIREDLGFDDIRSMASIAFFSADSVKVLINLLAFLQLIIALVLIFSFDETNIYVCVSKQQAKQFWELVME